MTVPEEGVGRRGEPAAFRWLPGLATARGYRRAWLGGDLLGGLALAAVLIPAGMAYAQAAGLPAVTGLYTTVVALVVYAVLGPSRVFVVGPDSALVPLIAAAVLPLAAGSPGRAVALASLLAILAGALCVAGGLARLGLLSQMLSKPVRVGYLNGIAVTVILSQLPKLFGFSVSVTGSVPDLIAFTRGLWAGRTATGSLAVGVVCLALILALRARASRAPGPLIAIALATAAASFLGLHMPAIGPLPPGLPEPRLPDVRPPDVGLLAAGAFATAVVAFTDTSALSRSLAAREGREVDANQELLALGAANVAAGMFQGFAVSSSATRTPVASASGARTQLAGVVGAAVVCVLVVAAPGLLRQLPLSALAAVVIAAALGIFEVATWRRLFRLDRPEFLLSVASFLAVALLGVLPGIAVAVGLSLADFVRHAWRPHSAVLGRVPGRKGYHDTTRHPEAAQVPGLLLFRWDAPLFFANCEEFRLRVRRLVTTAPTPVHWLVVAAEPVTDVDSTAAEVLEALVTELEARRVRLGFAELKGPVKDLLVNYGLVARIGEDQLFPTIGNAVSRYVKSHPVGWVDWEDEVRPGGADGG